MPKRTKQQREKFAAANNVLTPEEQALANCRGVDPDLFFPERGASTREAKEVCRGCVIREGCLHIALITGEKFGIWGGMSERERRRLRRAGIVKELMVKYATTEEVQSDDEPDDDLEDLA